MAAAETRSALRPEHCSSFCLLRCRLLAQWNRPCPPRQQLDLDGLQHWFSAWFRLVCFASFRTYAIDAKLSPLREGSILGSITLRRSHFISDYLLSDLGTVAKLKAGQSIR